MYKQKKIAAIILIAGTGSRFNSPLPKQFHMLSGKKLYLHTYQVFKNLKICDQIIFAVHPDYINEVKKDLQKEKNIKIVKGGSTRQQSVYRSLLSLDKDTDIVSIHDGARPFILEEIIVKSIDIALSKKACNTCIHTFDTIIKTIDQETIENIPTRKHLLRGQTPQTFCYKLILSSHKKALLDNIDSTDDCSLVLNNSHPVAIVKGDTNNIKITTSLDLFVAEQILRLRPKKINNKNISLQNKKYIVVGGAGGIGSAICKLLKKENAIVVAISRSTKPFNIDLENTKSIEQAFKKINKKYGLVDGLINSAGVLIKSSLKKISKENIKKIIDINLTGLILCCKEAKLQINSHIVNIASSSYSKGRENYSIYSASKAAVVNFTQAISEELKGVKVNTIVPNRTATKMRKENFQDDESTLLSPEEVAQEIIKILKDQNTTGSIIEIKKTPRKIS